MSWYRMARRFWSFCDSVGCFSMPVRAEKLSGSSPAAWPDFGVAVGVVGCLEAGGCGGCWLTGERFRLRFGIR